MKTNYTYPQNISAVMQEAYTTKEFLPIVGLNENTFRQWSKRSITELQFPGTGRTAKFSGHEIVYIGALNVLSLLGFPPSKGKKGLKRNVLIFTDAFVRGTTTYKYCVAKSRKLGDEFLEWDLCQTITPAFHVVAANGGYVVPGGIYIDLLDLSEQIAKGLYEIFNSK